MLDALRANGPMTVTELGGARRGGEWWDWSDVKIAVEWLLDVGEVVCTERRAWKRVYDLPERALPPEVLADEPDDETCLRRLVGQAGVALGVATIGDLADYHRLKRDQVRAVLDATDLVPVDGRGLARRGVGRSARRWRRSRRAGAIAPRCCRPSTRSCGTARGRCASSTSSTASRPTCPAPKRVHGYFAMPLLAGGRLRGRVDPGREGTTLVAKRLSCEPGAVEAMAQALREAAEWVGCDAVALETVDPPELAQPLRALA